MLCSLTPPETDNEIFGKTFKFNPQANKEKKSKALAEGASEVDVSSSSTDFCEDSDEPPSE